MNYFIDKGDGNLCSIEKLLIVEEPELESYQFDGEISAYRLNSSNKSLYPWI